MEEIILRIEQFADGGMCLARHEGKAVFVAHSAPGDLMRVGVTKRKQNYMFAKPLEIIEASPARTKPLCGLFGTCGGCSWQHVDYAAQIKGKAESFANFFKSRLKLGDEAFLPPLESPKPYGYRNRADFNVAQTPNGPKLGFLQGARPIAVAECPVLSPSLNMAIAPVNELLSILKTLPQRIKLQEDDKGVYARLYFDNPPGGKVTAPVESYKSPFISGTSHNFSRSPGELVFTLEVSENSYEIKTVPGSFVQANIPVFEKIAEVLDRNRAIFEDANVLELFCGSGFFTFPLAKFAKNVIAIEGDEGAISSLKANIDMNSASNIQAHYGPVEELVSQISARIDFCFLDPPRNGAGLALGGIIKLRPRHIFYVSCSPPTLQRDLALLGDAGYVVNSLGVADMFPQTSHVEAYAMLTAKEVVA